MSAACRFRRWRSSASATKDDTGTTQTFLRDDTIFEALEYTWSTLATRLREMAFLTRGVDIRLVDERPEQPREINFYFEGGVKSFVRYLNRTRTVLHTPVYVDREVETTQVEAAIQYTDGFAESVFAFANTINTPDGGSHLTGLRGAVTRTINDYARKQGYLKDNEPNFTGDDTRQGMTAIVSVKVLEPQFEGQNKLKLLNNEVRYHVETAVADVMGQWLEENPRDARQIIEKARTAYRAREAARKARDLVIRKSALESLTLAGQAGRLLQPRSGASARSTSWRATAQAARRSRAGTAASRPSCPCAGRFSTLRRRVWTRR